VLAGLGESEVRKEQPGVSTYSKKFSMGYSAFFRSLCDKRRDLFLYLLALAIGTYRFFLADFRHSYGLCKYLVALEAEIVVNGHNLL
jgi:hypothetical protein